MEWWDRLLLAIAGGMLFAGGERFWQAGDRVRAIGFLAVGAYVLLRGLFGF